MRIRFLLLATALFAITGCTKDFNEAVTVVSPEIEEMFSGDNVVPNVLCVKFDRETAQNLAITRTRSGEIMTGNMTLDEICRDYDIVSIERIFPVNEFEERKRKYGLDLWYKVTVSGKKSNAEVAQKLQSTEGIEFVNPNRRIKRVGHGTAHYATAAELEQFAANTRADLPFNDPYLSEQWMLINDGTIYRGAVAGADINVAGAWAMTGGNNEVIVSVVDGGVDYNHPDLAGNMWSGIGRNFVESRTGTNNVTAEEHGTHVAGTVAAVSNNGIGISGIAGGTGSGNGAKIMSCQIFSTDDQADDSGTANAIAFGAENGAVISQNSWGYDYKGIKTEAEFAQSARLIKDAIDYFIDTAGLSDDGAQTGPMAGGVVIFAAGNDGKDQSEYPAAYSRCISVASIACNYQRAWYSTYNSTVDVCAPGGGGWTSSVDNSMYYAGYDGYNLSTLPTSVNNGDTYVVDGNTYVVDYVKSTGYGWMEGTSMACPHVSGAAALIVSYCGGVGFTNDRLKEILIESARDIDNYQSSSYRTKIGKLIDVQAALEMGGRGSIVNDPGAPVITSPAGQSNNFKLMDYESTTLKYVMTNYVDYNVTVSSPDLKFEKNNNTISIPVDGSKLAPGSYKIEVTATNDIKSTTVTTNFTIEKNVAPDIVKDKLKTIYFSKVGDFVTYKLSECFNDVNGNIVSFTSSSDNRDVAITKISGDEFTVTARGEGYATVSVIAKDAGNLTTDAQFMVIVNTTSLFADFYPNPCTDRLNIKLGEINGEAVSGNGKVVMRNSLGVEVFNQNVTFEKGKPLTLNVSNINPGRYSILVSCMIDGKMLSTTQTVIKK